MQHSFTGVFLKTGKWYSAFVKEIPGINTQGKNIPAARKNLQEAAGLFFETQKDISEKELHAVKEPIVEENFLFCSNTCSEKIKSKN